MKPSEGIRPISYLKAHAAQLVRDVEASRSPVIVTQNGEAKAVLQDIRTYEEQQESLAMLKIIAQSKKSLDAGHGTPLHEAFDQVRKHVRKAAPK
jgi:prevent-host-death family protein